MSVRILQSCFARGDWLTCAIQYASGVGWVSQICWAMGESGAISTAANLVCATTWPGHGWKLTPRASSRSLSKLVQAGSAMTNDTVRIVPSRRPRLGYLQQTTSGSCRAATATSSTARRATTRSIASVDGSQASPPGRAHLYVHHDSCASAPHLQTGCRPHPTFHQDVPTISFDLLQARWGCIPSHLGFALSPPKKPLSH
jgi:hypothetical protein